MGDKLTWRKASVIRVHHVSKRFWTPYVGEEVVLSNEHVVALIYTNYYSLQFTIIMGGRGAPTIPNLSDSKKEGSRIHGWGRFNGTLRYRVICRIAESEGQSDNSLL